MCGFFGALLYALSLPKGLRRRFRTRNPLAFRTDMNDYELITQIPSLPPRKPDSHKGTYGHVLVIGGSRGMLGAVALASNAALRGGAGLVTFAAPAAVQIAIAALCPCATSIPLPDEPRQYGDLRPLAEAFGSMDVLAVGPGMGVGLAQQMIVRMALGQGLPVVLDADGLNNLAKIDNWPAIRRCPLVLTPHPGELARMTGRPIKEIQSDRINAALAAVRTWTAPAGEDRLSAAGPLVLVLKGAGTVVTDGRRVFINDTGNPGMATGGTGDVLTGLTAAILAQGLWAAPCAEPSSQTTRRRTCTPYQLSPYQLSPFDAAVLAVNRHGRAGDLAAAKLGQISLIATDLIDHLPEAMRQ